MLNMIKPSLAATIGAVALGSLGIGSATAADIPTPQYQGQYYGGPQPYGGPPPEQAYAPPPVAYGYPPPPAPPAYYEYEAPPPVIVPRPYYFGRYYGPAYGYPYGVRGYGPYVARGYGRYDRAWGHGYRHW
jgi:hypothetical protein